jgi:hypothetical protein
MNSDPIRNAVSQAKQRALTHGFKSLGSYESSSVIADLFAGLSANASDPEEIRRKIDDVVWAVVSLISATPTKGFREALKTALADLKSISDACDRAPSDAGRPRRIAADALVLMTGRLPETLLPPQWEGMDFAHFGRLMVGPFNFDKKAKQVNRSLSPIDSPRRPKGAQDREDEDILLPLDKNSLLLPGILHQISARDDLMAIWPSRSAVARPASLSALGYTDGPPPDGVTTRQIQALGKNQKAEIARLANGASTWLRLCFGIRHETDPLNFSGIRLVAPPATAMVLSCLTEIICPAWPDLIRPREVLTPLTQSLPDSDRWHPDMQRSFYQIVFDLVRRRVSCDRKTFNKSAEWVGLFSQGDENDENNVFWKYAEGYVRILAQVRILNAARNCIKDLLSKHGFDLADFGKTVGGVNGFSPEDYYDLGRWSDLLQGRLRLGVVDPTKGATVRFLLGVNHWKFPKITEDVSPERFTRAVVDVVQRVRLRRLAPHDNALCKYVCRHPRKSLKKIEGWYIRRHKISVGTGALLDRLGRLGLSDRIAKPKRPSRGAPG